ncbi:MAG: hypothetical protein VX293_08380 [Candidatus Latescibacterota bacterium]|nr:hypothetical protein [Candidatus Latescibacterota bacterium]
MLALLAANAYLGIADANVGHIYWFLAAFAVLCISLLVFRLVSLFFAAQRKKKASWNTFRQLAKTRGLNPAQINVLLIIARKVRIKHPPKILGSIQMLDKVVQQSQERYEFSEKQLSLVESIREKLVSSKVRWSANSSEERRHLERARCSWNARMVHIAKDVVEKEMLKTTGDYDDRLKSAISELSGGGTEEELVEYKVQIRDVSAGGVVLLASQAFSGAAGDFALFFGESQRIPFVMENLCGEILSIETDVEHGYLILHFRFLFLESELRKGVIQYVYEKLQTKTDKQARDIEAQSVEGIS